MLTVFTLVAGLIGAYVYMGSMRPPPIPYHLINSLLGLLSPDVHTGRPSAVPKMTNHDRFPTVTPPPHTANLHGEIETLDSGVEVTHWYAESDGVTWHFVTAGEPGLPTVLMLHGLPESWWAFHHQISDLARDHYVIALDCKGYGQSDKRLELDYTAQGMAHETANLLDHLGVKEFIVVAHDRGAVIADHMTSIERLKGRFVKYVRMQQSFNEPHGEPRPPHGMFGSKLGEGNFQSKNIIDIIYNKVMAAGLSPTTLARLNYEFKFKGTAQAVRKYFQSNNFDIEHSDRHATLFAHMTMPILILQGKWDPGQHPEEYANSADFASDLRVEFVEANHFSHIENPTAVNSAIRKFLHPN